MNFEQCSHNKKYTEPCDDCELIYIDHQLPFFKTIVARMEATRDAILSRRKEAEQP